MPLLEIEQKFAWTLANLQLLKSNAGRPPFKQLSLVNSETFGDAYYDANNKLTDAGIWVRKRSYHGGDKPTKPPGSFVWEAKKAMPGSSFNRSTFEETRNTGQIWKMVSEHRSCCPGHEHSYGLDTMCAFTTNRHTFLADDRFTIVLDTTGFGHSVGEVELMTEDAIQGHADIDAFLKKYEWFYDHSNPTGKITAYFEKFGFYTTKDEGEKNR